MIVEISNVDADVWSINLISPKIFGSVPSWYHSTLRAAVSKGICSKYPLASLYHCVLAHWFPNRIVNLSKSGTGATLVNDRYTFPPESVWYCILHTLYCCAGSVIKVVWSNGKLSKLPGWPFWPVINGSNGVVMFHPWVEVKTMVRPFKFVMPSMPSGLVA